jgi:retinol dehydrogenase-12
MIKSRYKAVVIFSHLATGQSTALIPTSTAPSIHISSSVYPAYHHLNINMHNKFDPKRSIPSLTGKVILITGGNIGLGKASALALCTHNPAQLWITARNPTTGETAVSEIRALAPKTVSVKLLELDLTSFTSIKTAAKRFTREVGGRLDVLMLNAGIMGGDPGVTKEGYGKQFGTNHIGHVSINKSLFLKLELT